MSDSGWGIVFVLGLAVLIAVILVAVIWGIFSTARTKTIADAVVAQDGAYRKLAEEATAAQRLIAEQQERLVTDVADLRRRVAAMEQMLREVG